MNSLKQKQNGQHFADNILKLIYYTKIIVFYSNFIDLCF